MPIDRFNRARFEAALPVANNKHKDFLAGTPLWKCLGVIDGQFCYTVFVNNEVEIKIYSSMDAGGNARECAKDSIRFVLVDSIEYQPVAGKSVLPARWVTRVPGWEQRMTETLRTLWCLGRHLGTCPACNKLPLRLNRVKKPGPNLGKLFVTCNCNKYFKWLDGV